MTPAGTAVLEPRERLIVALDSPELAEAEALVERLAGAVGMYKVGAQLFTAAGPAAVEMVKKRGGRVFLDLKFHDIPATVAGAVREAARLGVTLLTVHASGGTGMLRSRGGGGRRGGARAAAHPGGDRAHQPRPPGAPAGARCAGLGRGARGPPRRPGARRGV